MYETVIVIDRVEFLEHESYPKKSILGSLAHFLFDLCQNAIIISFSGLQGGKFVVDVCVDGTLQLLSIQLDQLPFRFRSAKFESWTARDHPLHSIGESQGI